jgi:hypothetical protein
MSIRIACRDTSVGASTAGKCTSGARAGDGKEAGGASRLE